MQTYDKTQLFHLLGQLKHIFQMLEPKLEVNFTEFRALRIIRNNNNSQEKVSTKPLHQELLINKSATSQLLKNLELKGLLKRNMNDIDRRKIDIIITDKGQEILDKMKNYEKTLSQRIFDDMGEEKSEQFIKLYYEFLSSAKKVSEKLHGEVEKAT